MCRQFWRCGAAGLGRQAPGLAEARRTAALKHVTCIAVRGDIDVQVVLRCGAAGLGRQAPGLAEARRTATLKHATCIVVRGGLDVQVVLALRCGGLGARAPGLAGAAPPSIPQACNVHRRSWGH